VATDEILTGEGVLLDARPVSFGVRVLGGLVDAVVYLVAGYGLMLGVLAATAADLSPGLSNAVSIAAIATVTVIAPTVIETLSRGRSIGKLATGVRIVRDDGGPIRFRHAFVRALAGVGELWLTVASAAVITSLVHPRGKRVGDILAGTYAVRVSRGAKVDTALRMPPQLAGWARAADMRRLPDGLALAARQFLARTATLHPESRVQMGTELAAQVARFVAPAPPPGTHPEFFLAAVLAERRDRELAANLRHAQARDAEAILLHRLPHAVADPES